MTGVQTCALPISFIIFDFYVFFIFIFNLTIYQLLISNFTHIEYTELDIIGCGGEAINSGVKVKL